MNKPALPRRAGRKKGSGRLSKEFIEWKGETKSILDWSKEYKINCCVLETRYKKSQAGLMTLDDVFLTPVIAGNTPEAMAGIGSANAGRKTDGGLRVRAVEKLFESFAKHGLPLLESEVKNFVDTGKLGNAMSFFLKYKDFFPREKIESLDGDTSKNVAQFAVIFNNGEQPKHYTILDP